MRFSDSHEEMSAQDQHGIQLRTSTDVLVQVTDIFADEVTTAVMDAEDLLDSIHGAMAGNR